MTKQLSLAPFGVLALGALSAFVPQADEPLVLRTQYTPGLSLQTELTVSHASERTAFSMVRDGEEVDMSGRMGGPSTTARTGVILDTFIAVKDGAPTHVERTFETLGSNSARMRRDEEVVSDWSGPLEGVTLELLLEDGEVVVDVTDGSEPDDEALLEGHRLALGLDALLPAEGVALGDEWEIEGAALMRALGLDLDAVLFPPAPRPELEGGGGPGGGNRGGGFGGGAPAGFAGLFLDADWDIEATLAAELEDLDGIACYVIEFEGTGEAEVEERGGFGGGGGPRALAPFEPLTTTLAGSGTLELEGKLYFAKDAARPLLLEVEATTVVESETTRESRNGGEIQTSSTTEGTLELTLRVSEFVPDAAE